MKIRVLSLLLAIALVFSLSACSKEGSLGYLDKIISIGSNPDDETDPTDPAAEPDGELPEASTEDPTENPGENPTEDPTEGSDEEALPSLGVYDGETYLYANEFLGLQCQLDEGWEVYDARQLAALYGSMMEIITDEDVQDFLQNSNTAMIFFAEMSPAGVSANIVLEDVGASYGSLLSEEVLAQMSLDTVKASIESFGGFDITAEIVTVDISGTEHPAIKCHYMTQEIELYQVQVFIKVEHYFACITVGSIQFDMTEGILAMFSSL